MVFLDASIALELLLPGRAKTAEVEAALSVEADGEPAISLLTVHLMWHFGRLAGIEDEHIAHVISAFSLVDLTKEDYDWAERFEAGRDMEDALQVAMAVRSGCNRLVTLDRRLAKRYGGVGMVIEVV